MIKNEICDRFSVRIVDKTIDGVLGIELTEKLSGFVAVIYACYLPPENSVWGYGSTNIFAHILSELYLNANADFVFFVVIIMDENVTFLIQ